MNDLAKSLAAITILAMLGGLAVSLTSKSVHVPAGPAAVSAVANVPLPASAAAPHRDSPAPGNSMHDSSSVKGVK